MTEKLFPYDTNLLSKVEAEIEKQKKKEEFEKELDRAFENGINPYSLSDVAKFNRIHKKYFPARFHH